MGARKCNVVIGECQTGGFRDNPPLEEIDVSWEWTAFVPAQLCLDGFPVGPYESMHQMDAMVTCIEMPQREVGNVLC